MGQVVNNSLKACVADGVKLMLDTFLYLS